MRYILIILQLIQWTGILNTGLCRNTGPENNSFTGRSIPFDAELSFFGTPFYSINPDSILGSFIDIRDGKTYKTVIIGQQVWMAENLDFDAGEGCWVYDNRIENAAIYGRLYNWKTAIQSCPSGWHLPNGTEWGILKESLGGNNHAGGRMKVPGTDFWRFPNVTSEMVSGFLAFPGGYYDINGFFRFEGYACFFWSNKVMSEFSANFMILFFNNDFFDDHGRSDMKNGFSVRCVMD